jgi:hypothetical protein
MLARVPRMPAMRWAPRSACHRHHGPKRPRACQVRGRDRWPLDRWVASPALAQFGATAVVPEAVEASLQLGGIVLASIGPSREDAACAITQFPLGDYLGLEAIAGERG